jgi:hypothetical protein
MIILDDGGRKKAGYKGITGDCVIRAIAIALEKPYKEVYKELQNRTKLYGEIHNDKVARSIQRRGIAMYHGINRNVYESYLAENGWQFKAQMGIGTGCRVHLKKEELPKGRIIARLSRHLVAVIDGVIHDTHDCSRGGTRCVYGYYQF